MVTTSMSQKAKALEDRHLNSRQFTVDVSFCVVKAAQKMIRGRVDAVVHKLNKLSTTAGPLNLPYSD